MPREDRQRDAYRSEPESFKQSLYGKLTTPDALEEAAKQEAAEKKKKKGKFLGHENFYFWMCDLTEKHFMRKAQKTYDMPKAVEEMPEMYGRKKKKRKEKKPKEFPKAYREALDFLGWKLDPNVVMAAPRTAGIIGLILGVLIAALVYFPLTYSPPAEIVCGDGICSELGGEDPSTCAADCSTSGIVNYGAPPGSVSPILLLFIMFIPVFLTIFLVGYVQKYPLNAADAEKMRALTYVPEIMNYLVMQMRLQPNLERAVEFASEHGEGRIAAEFREVLWKSQVGIYESIEEGLDDMAYRWEPYSEEFKHAITLIRASVLVPSDIERNMLYDKAIDDLLTSTKDKMELYAHAMKQPSMYLFYIAVLMPLMIIIMLPVAAAFAGIPVASTPVLIILYIFVLPIITYVYAKSVLAKRPGGYTPPDIPDNHPDLPKKGTAKLGGMTLPILPVAIMILIAILFVGFMIESEIKWTEVAAQEWEDINQGKEFQQPTILQYAIPLAIALPIGFYLFAKSVNKVNIQEKIFKMELDFKDAMYLVASRLGEKKPLEDAIKYVKRFMPESKVATELLENVEKNIMVLGLTLKSAIFDPVYGAMKFIPSRLINSAFRIMTDSIELGPEVASTSLMSVSDQIRNIQKINDLMRKLLDDVTSMMSSMAKMIAPVVLGIVASLQQVIIAVITPLSSKGGGTVGGTAENMQNANQALSGANSAFSSFSVSDSMAKPFEFQLIVAFYVIILVIILSYFAGKVRYGDNKTAIMMTIGKTLPISITVFVVALYLGGGMVGGLAGR